MESAAQLDFTKYLVPEVIDKKIVLYTFTLFSQYYCFSTLQAPPTVYYVPNFVSQEEADLLWQQVLHELITNSSLEYDWTYMLTVVCCSSSQMDSTGAQEITKLGYAVT